MRFREWFQEAAQALGPLGQQLMVLRPQIAQAAQSVYDQWDQGEDDYGGICDEIAREVGGIIVSNLQADVEDGGQPGDDHAYVIAYNDTEAYGVDIHPSVYERGGGYVWKKIPDAVFRPEDVDIWPVDIDRASLGAGY